MHEHERRLEALQEARVAGAPAAGALALPAPRCWHRPGAVGGRGATLEDVLVGFPPTRQRPQGMPILAVTRLEAARGDRIGVVGPNGAGKTTLLRTMAGELPALEGFVRLGANVQPGYLAQLRGAAFPGATVLDAILAAARVENGPARSYLARFLFRGEDVLKPVSELSGGERSRLELALLGVTPANLLLLDEPTNHLDIPAREALETFLREARDDAHRGPHDRRLLESVCERLWVVEPGAAVRRQGGAVRRWLSRVACGGGRWLDRRGELARRVERAGQRDGPDGRRWQRTHRRSTQRVEAARRPRPRPQGRQTGSRRCPRMPTGGRSSGRGGHDAARAAQDAAGAGARGPQGAGQLRRAATVDQRAGGRGRGDGPGRGGLAGAVGAGAAMSRTRRRRTGRSSSG